MDEQTAPESSVNERLTAFFMPPEVAPVKSDAPSEEVPPQEAEAAPEESETPEEAPTDDLDDLDVDGTVYKLPKDLAAKVSEWKSGHLRQGDYTRKTQELADITRQAQSMAEAVQLRQAFETEAAKERNELAQVTAELDRYKQVDWSNLDVETYIKLKGQMDSLKDKASDLNKTLGTKAQEFQKKVDDSKKRAIQEGVKYLEKAIPGFGPETLQQARSSALTVGYTEGELDNVYDARFVAMSWKAAQYDKLQSGKAEAVANVQKAPPVVKPGATAPGQVAERKYKDVRTVFKKSGSTQDLARVLLARGIK